MVYLIPVSYRQADHSYANYLRKIDIVYDGADSITLNWFNEVFYKLLYYSINLDLGLLAFRSPLYVPIRVKTLLKLSAWSVFFCKNGSPKYNICDSKKVKRIA